MFDGTDYKLQGHKIEAKFQYDALNNNLIVSKPYGDSSPYDFIIDNGKKLLKIQVKSVKELEKEKYRKRYRCRITHKKGKKYSIKNIDILACYIIPLDIWYFIPISKATGIQANLYPYDEDSDGSYEKYKENWNILKT